MNRLFSMLGAFLVITGVAVLAYVGVSYAESQQHPAVAHWSHAQQARGLQLQSHLARQQRVALPRRLARIHVAAGSEIGLRMLIPKIGVDAPVVQTPPVNGVWDVADWSVGHLSTTPNPGGLGNAAYAAHDDIKGEIFKRLGELGPGDSVFIQTRHALYRYVVVNQLTVDPSNVGVLAPTPRLSTVTLISCTPYWVDTQRVIIKAVLKSTSAR